jgi:putative nucleotidyltransferase with HDIG domain
MAKPQRRLLAVWAVVFVALVAAAILTTRSSDWSELELLALLAVMVMISGAFPIEVGGMRASASFLGAGLATILLGPLPGLLVSLMNPQTWRRDLNRVLCNLVAFSVYPVTGGLAIRAVRDTGIDTVSIGFGIIVLAGFIAMNLLNFLAVAVDMRVDPGKPVGESLRRVWLPVLPVNVATALLCVVLVIAHEEHGIGVMALVIVVGLVFQYLLHLVLESMNRGEQLARRTQELAALQVGLLTTVLNTLSLRDKMTARHSAAVARYAKAIARELGLDEREQDVIHTAGLLHDIGKFVFPDDILLAETRLTEEQYRLVKTHPVHGAELVGQIEGYGPVADIVRTHHERIDGRGYPDGLIADEIPLGARIIAVCDTYDVMTARDSYRQPVSREEAVAELQEVAGSQLDAQIVEVFIRLLRERDIAFRHSDDADFFAELNFERKVRDYAAPRVRSDVSSEGKVTVG